jgi:alpha-N-arabinofuranosidase
MAPQGILPANEMEGIRRVVKSKLHQRLWLGLLPAVFFCASALAVPVLTIDAGQSIAHFTPTFAGLMTEEINHSYDGGLYAELIQNRSFKDDAKQPIHWSVNEGGSIALDESQPIANTAQTVCLKADFFGASAGHRVGVANDGYWGIPVKPSTTYRASFYAKGDAIPLTASIESNDGKIVFAAADVAAINGDWQKYTVTLTTKAEVTPGTTNHFFICSQKPGTIWLNLVSLIPPTWHDRPNGNRIDLMQWMSDLNPSFLRCPGGNYLEGNTVETRFNWENTIGDISQRPGHMGCWGYRSSEGLGLLEFLQWAEDLKAEPVLAVYAGYSLPNKSVKGLQDGTAIKAGADLEPFVQEAIDEIEYATGDTTTKWGARRAADGHPAPFQLHYVEIGNEDFMKLAAATYEARYAQFYDELKAKYPKLQFISTITVKGRTPDAVDDHYYKTSDEMAKLAHRYDKQDRNGPKVFVGEWATREIPRHQPDGTTRYVMMPWGYKGDQTPAMHAALGDAAFLTGMERNADIVVMNCYAPLLVNVNRNGGFQWCPNLIGYDALISYASPSYYVQQMFNQNRGDTVVKATMTDEPKDFFYSVTRDEKNVYIKTVNRSADGTSIKIHLDGVKIDSANAKSTVLSSANVDDLNKCR